MMNKLKQDTCIQVRTKVGMTEVWGHQACALGKSLTQRSLKKMDPNIGKGGEVSSKACVDSHWQKMLKYWECTEAFWTLFLVHVGDEGGRKDDSGQQRGFHWKKIENLATKVLWRATIDAE